MQSLAFQRFFDAFVHAQGGKGFGFLCQGVCGGIDFVGLLAVGCGGLQGGDLGFDGGTLIGAEQMAVGIQGSLRGQDEAVGFQPRFNQGARLLIRAGSSKAFLIEIGRASCRERV